MNLIYLPGIFYNMTFKFKRLLEEKLKHLSIFVYNSLTRYKYMQAYQKPYLRQSTGLRMLTRMEPCADNKMICLGSAKCWTTAGGGSRPL